MSPAPSPSRSPAVPSRRRLVAVAFADVVGFASLCELDDERALARWRRVLDEVIRPKLEAHSGNLLRGEGDSVFVSFESCIDAVRWARDVQLALRRRGKRRGDAERELTLRIGINLADAIVDAGEVHGDGVNIAERARSVAGAGEIVATAAVVEQLGAIESDLVLTDLGEPPLKNISRPIRLYRVELQAAPTDRIIVDSPLLRARAARLPGRPALPAAWSKRPSIAVLPFRNLGRNPREDYFGEGVTEDIIAALSRTSSLVVTARSSTLKFAETRPEPREIAAQLGVRYLLDGSFRLSASRLRISAQLIDATTGRAMWVDTPYDEEIPRKHLFDAQRDIAARIVATIEPKVVQAETERVQHKPTASLDAYECVLRALPLLNRFDDEDFAEAQIYLERALELDPSYAQAHAHMAWLQLLLVAEGRAVDAAAGSLAARHSIERARALAPEDPHVLAVAGHVRSLLLHDPEGGARLFDRSLALNQNSAFAWGMSGLTYCYLGEADEALARFDRVWRLSPFDPYDFFFLAGAGLAHFLAGRHDEALPWLHKALQVNGRFAACLRHMAACLGEMGRIDEAEQVGREMLRLSPDFRVAHFASWYPLRPQANLRRYIDGLRRARLPEGAAILVPSAPRRLRAIEPHEAEGEHDERQRVCHGGR